MIAAQETMQRNPANPSGRLFVLVVEDNPDCADTLATLLQLWGYRWHVTHNGLEAIEAAKLNNPDVVILDLGLPGMSGFEVAGHLQAPERERPPFIIAVTGYAQEEDRRRAAECGIHLHLAKPAAPEQLQMILRRFEMVVAE